MICCPVHAAVGESVTLKMDDLPAIVAQDQEYKQDPESHRRNREEVDRHDVLGVIGQERPPCL